MYDIFQYYKLWSINNYQLLKIEVLILILNTFIMNTGIILLMILQTLPLYKVYWLTIIYKKVYKYILSDMTIQIYTYQ